MFDSIESWYTPLGKLLLMDAVLSDTCFFDSLDTQELNIKTAQWHLVFTVTLNPAAWMKPFVDKDPLRYLP